MSETSIKNLLAGLIGLCCALFIDTTKAENVVCDAIADTSLYFCRGWRDGVGQYGSRVRFIARMMGDDQGDDFGYEVVWLGDINGDGRGDFMVSVKNECEWRLYHGDTLIAKEPAFVWPKGEPPYPCGPAVGRFFSTPDISGDGQQDLFRVRSTIPRTVEIYFAGAAFDTLPDLIIADTDFVFPGGAGGEYVAAGLDLNGDGQPDFVLGDPSFIRESPKEFGRAYIFWGGTALDSIPDLIISDTFWVGQNQPYPVGAALGILQSVNGDAYADLFSGRASENYVKDPPGRIDVFYGGPGMDTVRDLSFESPDSGYVTNPPCGYLGPTGFGLNLTSAGDVNQDSYDDLLIPGPSCVRGYVYYGGPSFDSLVDLRLTSLWPREEDGSTVTGWRLGDINADGYVDFCTVYVGDGSSLLYGWIRIHFSRPNPTGAADWIIAGEDWLWAVDAFGRAVTNVGDVDGDGFDDIAIGTRTSTEEQFNRGAVFIYAGYDPDIYSGVFDEPDAPLPAEYRLIDFIAPNPFNSATTIRLSDSFVAGKLTIYDILGRSVQSFNLGAGEAVRELHWDGRDARGTILASGLYFARATDGAKSETHKLVLLK